MKQSTIYLLLLLLSSCKIQTEAPSSSMATPDRSPPPVNIPTPVSKSAAVDPNFIVAAVDKVGPSVVRIDSARVINKPGNDEFDDPFFRRFFGMPQQQERIERGSGSGFIISNDGQILTNSHVVNGADKVQVKLKDGRSFDGKVLGEDSLTDLAVVKIQADNLPGVNLGNSDQLKPGEWAIAIGNPLGLDNTVTVGIISATGRSSSQIGVPDKRVGFIQTDTAINPGNSGGPLLNAAGDVIGINTAIIRDAQGIGFAIPINTAKVISQQLITKGKAEHPYLGVFMKTITPDLKQQINNQPRLGLRIQEDVGVIILRIGSNSPAAKAGLRPGDVITKINNQPIKTAEEVQQIIENTGVNGKLELEVSRSGQIQTLTAQLSNLPRQKNR